MGPSLVSSTEYMTKVPLKLIYTLPKTYRLFHNVIGAFFNALSINDIPEAAE